MAHPYSTEERLRRLAAGKSTRLDALADRDDDGVADEDPAPGGVMPTVADVLERAANRIDSALGAVYLVPFAGLTGSPSEPTYPVVGDITDRLALAALYFWVDPESADATALVEEAEADLERYRLRQWVIPGAPTVSAAAGPRGVRYESIGTYVAGGCTDGSSSAAYTTNTTDQTRGL